MSNSKSIGVAYADPSFESIVSTGKISADVTIDAADLSSGAFNLTEFTVRPSTTFANTVAAVVGATNSRTAGVAGGNIFGCYAQTSLGTATSTITGLNAAVYGVVDVGPSANAGATYGAVFDFAQFTGTRAVTPKAFIGFGEESSSTNPCLNLFDIGRLGKNVAAGLAVTSGTPTTPAGQIRVLVNGSIRYIQLFSTSA